MISIYPVKVIITYTSGRDDVKNVKENWPEEIAALRRAMELGSIARITYHLRGQSHPWVLKAEQVVAGAA